MNKDMEWKRMLQTTMRLHSIRLQLYCKSIQLHQRTRMDTNLQVHNL